MKKLIGIIYFQIGVNVIGLPDIFSHNIYENKLMYINVNKSKFHK